MKKNILAIAILAAVIANIILSVVILFSVVPAANNANKLVQKICTVINLELENPDAATYAKVPLASRVPYQIGDKLTVGLKKGEGDTKAAYALATWSLILNSDAPNYKEVTAVIDNQKAVLNDHMISLIKGYTADELEKNEAALKGELISYCRTYFRTSDSESGDELVVDVALTITIQR
jgi:flagellar FliL protein